MKFYRVIIFVQCTLREGCVICLQNRSVRQQFFGNLRTFSNSKRILSKSLSKHKDSKMSDKSVDILILGAGLSGLSAAFQLSKKVRFVKTQCENLVIFLPLRFT